MSEGANECDVVQSLLLDKRSGPLLPAAQGVLDEHVAKCQSCRQVVAWEERFVAAVRAIPQTPPSALQHLVQRKLAERRRRWWLAASSLAASFLVALTLLLGRPWESSEVTIVEIRNPGPAVAKNDDAELLALFGPPPVDTLDVLSQQQGGYMTALKRLGKE